MDVQLAGSSMAHQFFLNPGGGVTLGARHAARLIVKGKGAVLLALKLHLAVPALSPRGGLWLSAIAFHTRIPAGLSAVGGRQRVLGFPGSPPELAQNRDCAAVCSDEFGLLSEKDCW